jgi:DNA-binding NtrC family response regulator
VGRREQFILVVEDEASVRLAISEYLTEQEFHVHQASGAAGAIDMILAHPEIELVFTDLAMPGNMDGLDLVDWLLKNRPGLPVIITSGVWGRVGIMAEYSRSQALSYFTKPYQYEALATKIRQVIEERGQ